MTDFEEIYREHFQNVFLFIKSLSHDEQVAEEITSETFFKALKVLDSFKGNCDIRVWLCQIAKNCYFSYLKRMKRTLPIEDMERVFAELSFKKIGELFGKTDNWACVTFHRAKGKLRENWRD